MNIIEELKLSINNLEDRLESALDLLYRQDKIISEMGELLNTKLGFDLLELQQYKRPKFNKNGSRTTLDTKVN